MRLIDAKGLFDKVGKIKPRSKEHYKSIGEFMNLITNSPTIDAVEVVRCNNCKKQSYCHRTVGKTKRHDAFVEYWSEGIEWCSKGERREDGES